jgi:hypothetical protein
MSSPEWSAGARAILLFVIQIGSIPDPRPGTSLQARSVWVSAAEIPAYHRESEAGRRCGGDPRPATRKNARAAESLQTSAIGQGPQIERIGMADLLAACADTLRLFSSAAMPYADIPAQLSSLRCGVRP